jgi:hypothetical protein
MDARGGGEAARLSPPPPPPPPPLHHGIEDHGAHLRPYFTPEPTFSVWLEGIPASTLFEMEFVEPCRQLYGDAFVRDRCTGVPAPVHLRSAGLWAHGPRHVAPASGSISPCRRDCPFGLPGSEASWVPLIRSVAFSAAVCAPACHSCRSFMVDRHDMAAHPGMLTWGVLSFTDAQKGATSLPKACAASGR